VPQVFHNLGYCLNVQTFSQLLISGGELSYALVVGELLFQPCNFVYLFLPGIRPFRATFFQCSDALLRFGKLLAEFVVCVTKS